MYQLEDFKTYLKQTMLYSELSKCFAEYEVFEMTKEVFEIQEVQAAFEKWVKQQATDHKRSEFTKNLKHLISGDYVLVRKST